MFSRAGLRFANSSRQTVFHQQPNLRNAFRRPQTTAAAPEAPAQGVFQRLWTSPVGIKTVHFWAPIMKWGVVLAGASDFLRPAEKLSLTQNLALMATGSIWTRWCFVIIPKNMLLAAVNFCLFCVGSIQTSRIFFYHKEMAGSSGAALSNMWGIVKGDSKKVEKKVQEEAKEIEKKATA